MLLQEIGEESEHEEADCPKAFDTSTTAPQPPPAGWPVKNPNEIDIGNASDDEDADWDKTLDTSDTAPQPPPATRFDYHFPDYQPADDSGTPPAGRSVKEERLSDGYENDSALDTTTPVKVEEPSDDLDADSALDTTTPVTKKVKTERFDECAD